MIDDAVIREIVERNLEKGMFLVNVKVTPSNRIIVHVDSEEGVTIEDCVRMNRLVEQSLDRDVEDFELEVSSPGLSEPLRVLKQYHKNLGKEVEVLTSEGTKHRGVLKEVKAGSFTIDEKVKEKEKTNRKRSVEKIKEREFEFESVKATRLVIEF